jgi:hypothetical protein
LRALPGQAYKTLIRHTACLTHREHLQKIAAVLAEEQTLARVMPSDLELL